MNYIRRRFSILTIVVANVVNLAMFLLADIGAQSSAAVFGQAVTMIMSQRIILNLQGSLSSFCHFSHLTHILPLLFHFIDIYRMDE